MKRRMMHEPNNTWFAAVLLAAGALAGWAAGATRAAEPLPGHWVNHEVPISLSTGLNLPAGPRLTPAAPNDTPAIDCVRTCPPGCEASWKALQSETDFQQWAQGE